MFIWGKNTNHIIKQNHKKTFSLPQKVKVANVHSGLGSVSGSGSHFHSAISSTSTKWKKLICGKDFIIMLSFQGQIFVFHRSAMYRIDLNQMFVDYQQSMGIYPIAVEDVGISQNADIGSSERGIDPHAASLILFVMKDGSIYWANFDPEAVQEGSWKGNRLFQSIFDRRNIYANEIFSLKTEEGGHFFIKCSHDNNLFYFRTLKSSQSQSSKFQRKNPLQSKFTQPKRIQIEKSSQSSLPTNITQIINNESHIYFLCDLGLLYRSSIISDPTKLSYVKVSKQKQHDKNIPLHSIGCSYSSVKNSFSEYASPYFDNFYAITKKHHKLIQLIPSQSGSSYSLITKQFCSLQNTFSKICIGQKNCFALTQNCEVWAWGQNANGQLGCSDYESRKSPYPVITLEKYRVLDIFQLDEKSTSTYIKGNHEMSSHCVGGGYVCCLIDEKSTRNKQANSMFSLHHQYNQNYLINAQNIQHLNNSLPNFKQITNKQHTFQKQHKNQSFSIMPTQNHPQPHPDQNHGYDIFYTEDNTQPHQQQQQSIQQSYSSQEQQIKSRNLAKQKCSKKRSKCSKAKKKKSNQQDRQDPLNKRVKELDSIVHQRNHSASPLNKKRCTSKYCSCNSQKEQKHKPKCNNKSSLRAKKQEQKHSITSNKKRRVINLNLKQRQDSLGGSEQKPTILKNYQQHIKHSHTDQHPIQSPGSKNLLQTQQCIQSSTNYQQSTLPFYPPLQCFDQHKLCRNAISSQDYTATNHRQTCKQFQNQQFKSEILSENLYFKVKDLTLQKQELQDSLRHLKRQLTLKQQENLDLFSLLTHKQATISDLSSKLSLLESAIQQHQRTLTARGTQAEQAYLKQKQYQLHIVKLQTQIEKMLDVLNSQNRTRECQIYKFQMNRMSQQVRGKIQDEKQLYQERISVLANKFDEQRNLYEIQIRNLKDELQFVKTKQNALVKRLKQYAPVSDGMHSHSNSICRQSRQMQRHTTPDHNHKASRRIISPLHNDDNLHDHQSQKQLNSPTFVNRTVMNQNANPNPYTYTNSRNHTPKHLSHSYLKNSHIQSHVSPLQERNSQVCCHETQSKNVSHILKSIQRNKSMISKSAQKLSKLLQQKEDKENII